MTVSHTRVNQASTSVVCGNVGEGTVQSSSGASVCHRCRKHFACDKRNHRPFLNTFLLLH